MSALTLRSVKGSALTSAEIDANFTNLNTDKLDKSAYFTTSTIGIAGTQGFGVGICKNLPSGFEKLDVGFIYNSWTAKWRCVAVA